MKKFFVSFIALTIVTSAFGASSLVSSGKSGTVSRAGSLRTTPAKSETSTKSANVSASVSSGAATTSARLPNLKNMTFKSIVNKTGAYSGGAAQSNATQNAEMGALMRRIDGLESDIATLQNKSDMVANTSNTINDNVVTALNDSSNAKTIAIDTMNSVQDIVATQGNTNARLDNIESQIGWANNVRENVYNSVERVQSAKSEAMQEIGEYVNMIRTAATQEIDDMIQNNISSELAERIADRTERELTDRMPDLSNLDNRVQALESNSGVCNESVIYDKLNQYRGDYNEYLKHSQCSTLESQMALLENLAVRYSIDTSSEKSLKDAYCYSGNYGLDIGKYREVLDAINNKLSNVLINY